MNNYLEFLLHLWQITKEAGGFKTWKSVFDQYPSGKSLSAVLRANDYVVLEDGKWQWTAKKPTKKMTAEIEKEAAEFMANKKEAKTKPKAAKKSPKPKKIILVSDNTSGLVEELKSLGDSISEMGKVAAQSTPSAAKAQVYRNENELNEDVKKVLKAEAADIAKTQHIRNLEEGLRQMEILINTERELNNEERKANLKEIDRLMLANESMDTQFSNIAAINSELREKLTEAQMANEILESENTQLKDHMNTMSIMKASQDENIQRLNKELEKIKGTKMYRLGAWFGGKA